MKRELARLESHGGPSPPNVTQPKAPLRLGPMRPLTLNVVHTAASPT